MQLTICLYLNQAFPFIEIISYKQRGIKSWELEFTITADVKWKSS